MNNTNVWDVFVIGIYTTYIAGTLGGVVWLIDQRGWSPWWIVVWAITAGTLRVKTGCN